MALHDNILDTIGNTPIVKLQRIAPKHVTLYAKVESFNPGGSVKDRLALAIVLDAEAKGLLKPGDTIVEATSGNTGVALAMVAAARGYTATLTMPESMSLERRRVLAALGADLVLTPASAGMAGAVQRAEEMARESPGRFFMPDQFSNPANPLIHERTTGPEIWAQTDGKVAAVVASVGTGGTVVGIGRAFKNLGATVQMVAVEPTESPLLTQYKAGDALRPAPHGIQGIGANFIPKVVDFSVIDRIETVGTDEAFEVSRRLAREEGVLSGISCGAAVAAALRLAAEDAFAGRLIVAILPDSGERYLSTSLFD